LRAQVQTPVPLKTKIIIPEKLLEAFLYTSAILQHSTGGPGTCGPRKTNIFLRKKKLQNIGTLKT
jgi:hypothetical protein